jgi:hypothetical protein
LCPSSKIRISAARSRCAAGPRSTSCTSLLHGVTRTISISCSFAVTSRWWRGGADITTFRPEELLGTKLRALFQRKKGRDLFDLCVALEAGIQPAAVVDIFRTYTKAEGREITRADFEKNLAAKLRQPAFTDDLLALLPPGVTFDIPAGGARVMDDIIALLPGDPWKGRAKRRI